jgi:hypothetical protein
MIKSRVVIWAGLVVRVGGTRNRYIPLIIKKLFSLENLKRRDHFEDKDVDEKTLQKFGVRV